MSPGESTTSDSPSRQTRAEPSTTKWYINMCGAPGASAGASARQWGVESRQGAENSALKKIAPFNRTPFNTSENASILLRLPPGAPTSWRPREAFYSLCRECDSCSSRAAKPWRRGATADQEDANHAMCGARRGQRRGSDSDRRDHRRDRARRQGNSAPPEQHGHRHRQNHHRGPHGPGAACGHPGRRAQRVPGARLHRHACASHVSEMLAARRWIGFRSRRLRADAVDASGLRNHDRPQSRDTDDRGSEASRRSERRPSARAARDGSGRADRRSFAEGPAAAPVRPRRAVVEAGLLQGLRTPESAAGRGRHRRGARTSIPVIGHLGQTHAHAASVAAGRTAIGLPHPYQRSQPSCSRHRVCFTHAG